MIKKRIHSSHVGESRSDDCSPLVATVEGAEIRLMAYARGQCSSTRLQAERLPELRSIGVWDAVGPQNWGLPMHCNEGIEVCYVLSGQIHFSTSAEEWTLRGGDMTITRPGQRHRLGRPNITACKFFWFIIDVEQSSIQRPQNI